MFHDCRTTAERFDRYFGSDTEDTPSTLQRSLRRRLSKLFAAGKFFFDGCETATRMEDIDD